MLYELPALKWKVWCVALLCAWGLTGCGDDSESSTTDLSPADVPSADLSGSDTLFGDLGDLTDGLDGITVDTSLPDSAVADTAESSDMTEDLTSDLTPDVPDVPGPVTAVLTSGASALTINTDEPTITLTRNGTVHLRFRADGFLLGNVGRVLDAINYDPYPLFAADWLLDKPPLPEWLEPTDWEISNITDTSIHLKLRYTDKITAVIVIDVAADDRFSLSWVPDGDNQSIAYLRLRAQVDSNEGFYGLGEWFDTPEHRGTVRAMQMEPDLFIESAYNEAHVPIPFLIGTQGWGLFVESLYPGVFAVASLAPDIVDVVYGPGLKSDEGLKTWVFTAPHPLDTTKHYYDITGPPKLPAPWALGPWIWRDENDDQAQVESDLETIRALDLATVGYWIDRPYATAVNTFDFYPAQFPDPTTMMQKLKDLGFRTALWHTPYLDEKDPNTLALRDFATNADFYPPVVGLIFNKWGKPLDVTVPAAREWWKQNLKSYMDLGVNGFKLDYGEDVVPGVGPFRNVWKFADGSDERTMHVRFQPLYHGMYADLLPEEGGFLLCRAARFGEQTLGLVIWPGDLDANFAWHKEKITKPDGTTYNAVGGLPASIIAGLSLGPSGFPFYGADTGGYRHAPPNKETFVRWFQQTALSTVMQIGMGSSDVAWEYTESNGFDDEMLDWYRIYTRLHLRLFPLLWTYAHRMLDDGRPIQRPLGLAFPDLGQHPKVTYMLGDDLLVAPVVQAGATQWNVVFPTGQWVDWWTGEMVGGPQTLVVDAPLWKLPLYLREGGIVPLLRPTIDTLSETTMPELVDSFATDAGLLWVRVVPGQSYDFIVYDGTQLAQNHAGEAVLVSITPGDVFKSGAYFEVWWQGISPTVVLNGNEPMIMAADVDSLSASDQGWTVVLGDPFPVKIKVAEGSHTLTILTLSL